MAGIGEGMSDRGVPCGKEIEGNDLLLFSNFDICPGYLCSSLLLLLTTQASG